MSFSRVKPDNWAVNEKLTSAQQNQLDIDHAKAVDKTGDTITGDVHVGNAARILVDNGGKIVNQTGGVIELQNGSNTNVASGGTVTWQSGSFLTASGATLAISGASSFTVGASVTSTFNNLVTFNGPGSLSPRIALENGADLRVKTGSRLYLENGSSTYFDTSANIDMLADIAFGIGHVSSYPNGAQIFYSGASTHTSTSVDTYASSSQTIHQSGSLDTYQSGALLTQSSGSVWTMAGTTNVASGGNFVAQSGSNITFTAVPVFSNGLTISGGTTAIAGTLDISAASTFSGSFTTSSTANFSGTTTVTGSSNRLKVTTRDVKKKIPISSGIAEVIYSDGAGGWIDTQSPTYIGSTDTLLFQVLAASTDVHKFNVPLYPPNGCVLKSIEITWTGTCEFSVFIRRNGTSIGGNVTTTPGTITISPGIAVDTSTQSFSVEITAKKVSTNEFASVSSLFATYTVSEYDPGAG